MKKILIFIFLVVSAINSFGQKNYGYVAWNYQIPMSNRTYLSEGASRGGAVGYRVFLNDENRVSLGAEFNWTTFTQYAPTETFYTSNGAFTTDYFKYIYSYGAVVNGQYYIPVGSQEIVFPYVGLGLGANLNTYTLYYNIYTNENQAWGFLARPEAGIAIRFSENRSLGAFAAIHYDYSTNKDLDSNYKNFQALGFKLGLVFMSR